GASRICRLRGTSYCGKAGLKACTTSGIVMKAFANVNPRDLEHAVSLLSIVAPERGRTTAIAGGGSDLLGMVKERLIAPDVLVNLKSIPNLDRVTSQGGAVVIGGQMTLDALSHDPIVRSRY